MNFNHSISGLLATLGIALLAIQGQTAAAQQQHSLPLVKPAGGTQESFLRIINRSDRAGEVTIHAIDDSGNRDGPITLSLAANQTKHLSSRDLEEGNPRKGLSGGIDDGDGDWRLHLTTDLDIEPLAYIRTPDGFVTSMHDVVQPEHVYTPGVEDYLRYRVWFFNPGTNPRQRSLLRVINVAGIDNEITINALDDEGVSGGEVSFTLGPYEALTIRSDNLEGGDDSLTGSFGNGAGKWQLIVTTESARSAQRTVAHPIQVMSLLQTPTGHLANLSSIGADNDFNRGTSGTDWLWGSEGDDILNPGDNEHYDGTLGSEGDDTIVYSDSGPSAFQWLGYYGLTTGINATINGETNRGTVRKGASGTDTIVDISNPLNAPRGGFGLGGSPQGDRFDLTLDDGQWMEVRGEAGDDRITIRSGQVRVTYRHAPNSIDVDLERGVASDDGHGDTDTIIGTVFEVQGGLGDDIIRGTNGGDRLDGGPGNDMLYPRNNRYREGNDKVFGSFGNDTIHFSDAGEGAWNELYYDPNWRAPIFSEGINATIDGVSNRATVDKGSAGTDTIIDISTPISLQDGGFALEGTSFDDVFNLNFREGQWIQVRGEAGRDTFNVSSGSHVTGRIDYSTSPAGIDIDLARGRADNDGHGDVDIINGSIWEVRGSNHDDVMRGSDRGESFAGLAGNDVIDGRGGHDRVRWDTGGGAITLEADLQAGTATGVWQDGSAFTQRLVNIEELRGSNGNDLLLGDSGDNNIRGRSGDDEIWGRGGDDHLRGEQGADVFVFEPGHGEDYIQDFSDGEDLIMFRGLTLNSKDDVLNNAHAWNDGVGVWIDFRAFGGGTLSLGGLPRENFDRSDFVF